VSFAGIVLAIWQPGVALALSTIAFGGLAAFLPLLYTDRQWDGLGIAFGAFGSTYVLTRLIFGGLPDRIGGRTVAIVSLLIEVAGQLLLWRAGTSSLAALGAALTGCGFSLVFPALGIEALARASSKPKGITLGAYVAFFDLSLASTGPFAGLIASRAGYPIVFLIGGLGAAAALLLTLAAPRILSPLSSNA
jgi:predicted MFS family arabinose efflux permease